MIFPLQKTSTENLMRYTCPPMEDRHASFSQDRITDVPVVDSVIYQSKGRLNTCVFDPQDG